MKNLTPANLDELTVRIICFRPPQDMAIDAYVKGAIRDYLSQKFGVALLNNQEHEKVISDLWFSITGERL